MGLDNGTNCQKAIYDEIERIFVQLSLGHYPECSSFAILGAAGVGKSWLTSEIVKLANSMRLKCYLSTPTHKAVRVLNEMIENLGLKHNYRVQSGTIHKFLNLKLVNGYEDENDMNPEKQRLVKNTMTPPEGLANCDILFVDEASMVDNNLYELTMHEMGERFRIVIFIADYFQLPPVGGNLSPIFYQSDKHRIFQLLETVRQKAGSHIINRAAWLKDYIANQNFPANILDLFISHDEVTIYKSSDPNEHAAFVSQYFNDVDHTKVVGTYTNKLVDEYNNYIRNILLNNPTDIVSVGERIIIQTPYEGADGNIIFTSNQEITVTKCVLKDSASLKYKVFRITDEDGNHANILHQDEIERYNEELESKLQLAKALNNIPDKKARSRAWSDYFEFINKYLNFKSAYASTIHKLQGSTYENCYLDLRTVPHFYPRNPDLMCRLLYVSITRPSNKLYILV